MKDILSRRSMLAGMGVTAATASVMSRLLSAAQAAEAAPGAAAPAAAPEIIMSMTFISGPKNKLDIKKYTTKHLPLLRSVYGDSVSRIEFRTGNATARGVPSDVMATTNIYIGNIAAFAERGGAAGAQIQKDLDEASKGLVLTQVNRQILAVGEARSEVREGHQVFSTFYQDKPDATFDNAYYTDVYIPKLRSYYGDNAIRRIEFCAGLAQGGRRPAFIASAHLFIRERSAFDTANGEAVKELMRTDEKYTNAMQMYADMRVTTII